MVVIFSFRGKFINVEPLTRNKLFLGDFFSFQVNLTSSNPELETSLYIYLDTSPSMAFSDDNFSIYDRSVSSLRKFLNDVPEKSEVLIRTSDPSKKFIGSNKDAQLFLNEIVPKPASKYGLNAIIGLAPTFVPPEIG